MVDATTTAATAASTSGTTARNTADNTESRAVLSSDFETFLKMLTVQVQNQDPMNPMDSSEYATQLATFSAVEQQVQTNDLLRGIGANLSGNALNEASRWIGMEGLVRAPVMYSGNPISVRPDYADGADSAQLVVRDSSGAEVLRYDLAVGDENVVWGGYDNKGDKMPTGIYRFDVESYDGDKQLSSTLANVYSRIEEVRNENGLIIVHMSDGTEIGSDQIGGLRAPMQ